MSAGDDLGSCFGGTSRVSSFSLPGAIADYLDGLDNLESFEVSNDLFPCHRVAASIAHASSDFVFNRTLVVPSQISHR